MVDPGPEGRSLDFAVTSDNPNIPAIRETILEAVQHPMKQRTREYDVFGDLIEGLRALPKDIQTARCNIIAQAAGPILVSQLDTFSSTPKVFGNPKQIEQLSRTASLFERIPATSEVSQRIYEAYQSGAFEIKNEIGQSVERQLLIALAISPPPLPEKDLEQFFVEQMDKGDYASVGFAGLRTMSMEIALPHLPQFLRRIQALGRELHYPVWLLLENLKDRPDLLKQIPQILEGEPELWQQVQESADTLKIVIPEWNP